MAHLLILRHAKAARPAGVDDFDRPLTPDGREAARLMGAAVAERAPDLALVSSARRARETFDLVAPALARAPRLEAERDLYDAGVTDLLARLRRVPPGTGTVLLVGHNPGLEALATSLTGEAEAEVRARLDGGMPTGTLAVLALDTPWADLKPADGRLTTFLTPAGLGGPTRD